MRIVIDLDKTLCKQKEEGQDYLDILPTEGAVEAVRKLKSEGHEIIISTSRGMVSKNNSLGKITAEVIPTIIEWLYNNNIPFDEIYPAKPLGDCYIDDKAIRFEGDWDKILKQIKEIK